MGDRWVEDVRGIDLSSAFSTTYPLQTRPGLRGIDLGSIFLKVDSQLQRSTGSCGHYAACPPDGLANSPSRVSLGQMWTAELWNGGPRRPLALYVPEDKGSEGDTPSISDSPGFGQIQANLFCTEELSDSGSDDDDNDTVGEGSDDGRNIQLSVDLRTSRWFGMAPESETRSIERLLGSSGGGASFEGEETVSWETAESRETLLEEGDHGLEDVPEGLIEMGIRQGCSRAAIVGANSYINRLKCHVDNGPIRNEKGWSITKRHLLILCLYLAAKVWQKDRISMDALLAIMNERGPDEWDAGDVNSAVRQIFQLLDYNILKDLLIDVNPAGVDLFCEAYIHIFPWTPASGS